MAHHIRSSGTLSYPVSLLIFLVPAALAASPAVTFEEGAVVVEGVTAGGEAAVYRVSRRWTGRVTRVQESADLLLDADGDGTVRLELSEAVPVMSQWVVVDLATGEFAVASPEGFTAREMELPGRVLGQGAPGELHRLELTGRVFHVLLVRSGQTPVRGAWSLVVGDGGREDEDGMGDGRMSFEVSRMTPLGESPPADRLAPGDVLAVIDPGSLAYFVTILGGPPEGGS